MKYNLNKDRLNHKKEYSSYHAMKARCQCPTSNAYSGYGGRGIKVCDRWLGNYGFKNFLEDKTRN